MGEIHIEGNPFKFYRLAANMRQEAVAKELGVERSTIAKWESGEAMPRADKIMKIADLYGCPAEALLTEQRNNPDRDAG